MSYPDIPSALRAQRDECLRVLRPPVRTRKAHLYAILDLAAASDASRWYRQVTTKSVARSLFDGQPEASAREQAPWLISIGHSDGAKDILQYTVNEAMASQSVCWLDSTLGIDELARRLACRMSVRLPEGDALLRYYDARLFAAFWRGLREEEQAHFGSFGERWWYLDENISLQDITLPGVAVDDSFEPPWHGTLEQMQALLNLSERHQLVDFLGKRMPDDFFAMDRGQRFHFVTRHDADARERHIKDFADRLRYCELALEYGDDFAGQSEWQLVWNEIVKHGIGLRAACTRTQPGTPA